ncbi:MAG: hypothetical protein ACLUEK_06800 [Oscillospiraceae bacterium]
MILLSACSAQPEPEVEETAAPETGETDWVYVPEFTRLADWAGCFALAGERLYFDGVETLASGQETGGADRAVLRSASALGRGSKLEAAHARRASRADAACAPCLTVCRRGGPFLHAGPRDVRGTSSDLAKL